VLCINSTWYPSHCNSAIQSSARVFINLCFVLFSPGGELLTGWSVGGLCQDWTGRDGAGIETGGLQAKREEPALFKVKASLCQASGWVKAGQCNHVLAVRASRVRNGDGWAP
jgi:hypothetical protein